MVEKLEDVWAVRDFPMLVEVTRRVDSGDGAPSSEELAAALSMDEVTARLALIALERRGLLELYHGLGGDVLLKRLSGQAYVLTGLHPDGDDLVTRLVQAAVQAAELTDDPEEKTRLRRFADSAVTVSREVMSGVLTAVLTRGMLGA